MNCRHIDKVKKISFCYFEFLTHEYDEIITTKAEQTDRHSDKNLYLPFSFLLSFCWQWLQFAHQPARYKKKLIYQSLNIHKSHYTKNLTLGRHKY